MEKAPVQALHQTDRLVGGWLILTAVMIFVMAVIGAITRLTESGLSMVEWRPLMGALPPLTEVEWQRVFQLYQATPQYTDINMWMDLAEFKTIFFWEWVHRFWGRFIGIFYGVPFLVFLMMGRLPKDKMALLSVVLVLGAAQGVMGWIMVQSGLVDVPAVSHYRLAVHLGLAFVLFSLTLYAGLGFLAVPEKYDLVLQRLKFYVTGALILFSMTFIWGAFVAGLDAGLIYNSFPKMGESFVPEDMWAWQPVWVNPFENPATVQFVHRWLAISTGLYMLVISFCAVVSTASKRIKILFCFLSGCVFFQIGLGILTLLSGVDIVFAVLHQAGALCILGVLTVLIFMLPRSQNVKIADV